MRSKDKRYLGWTGWSKIGSIRSTSSILTIKIGTGRVKSLLIFTMISLMMMGANRRVIRSRKRRCPNLRF
tara:strand:+ start:301 stop:510 length:210 start_codon:yes stop_codon:yes gene_type:complete